MIKRAILPHCRGATAIEYGLIAACIAMAIIGGLTLLGGSVVQKWGHVSTSVAAAMP